MARMGADKDRCGIRKEYGKDTERADLFTTEARRHRGWRGGRGEPTELRGLGFLCEGSVSLCLRGGNAGAETEFLTADGADGRG
jgi:hypothetical protein